MTICWWKQELLCLHQVMGNLQPAYKNWTLEMISQTIFNYYFQYMWCRLFWTVYIVKRLMSFQRWWWHFYVVGSSLHAWLRCNGLNCIGKVTHPFLDCGRKYWYVSASWSCMLKRAVLYIECTDTLHWNMHIHICMYTHTHTHTHSGFV